MSKGKKTEADQVAADPVEIENCAKFIEDTIVSAYWRGYEFDLSSYKSFIRYLPDIIERIRGYVGRFPALAERLYLLADGLENARAIRNQDPLSAISLECYLSNAYGDGLRLLEAIFISRCCSYRGYIDNNLDHFKVIEEIAAELNLDPVIFSQEVGYVELDKVLAYVLTGKLKTVSSKFHDLTSERRDETISFEKQIFQEALELDKQYPFAFNKVEYLRLRRLGFDQEAAVRQTTAGFPA